MKAAGYKSAGNYLGEYKLTAVESGHQWSDQLGRTLSKRSATRAIGPKTQAAEVATCKIGENFVPKAANTRPKNVPLATRSRVGCRQKATHLPRLQIQVGHVHILGIEEPPRGPDRQEGPTVPVRQESLRRQLPCLHVNETLGWHGWLRLGSSLRKQEETASPKPS